MPSYLHTSRSVAKGPEDPSVPLLEDEMIQEHARLHKWNVVTRRGKNEPIHMSVKYDTHAPIHTRQRNATTRMHP